METHQRAKQVIDRYELLCTETEARHFAPDREVGAGYYPLLVGCDVDHLIPFLKFNFKVSLPALHRRENTQVGYRLRGRSNWFARPDVTPFAESDPLGPRLGQSSECNKAGWGGYARRIVKMCDFSDL